MKLTKLGKLLVCGWLFNWLLITAILWGGAYLLTFSWCGWIATPRDVTLGSLWCVKVLVTILFLIGFCSKSPVIVHFDDKHEGSS